MSKQRNKQTKPIVSPEFGTEIASQSLTQWITSLDYLPNPDPILKAQGAGIKTYREIVDGHLDAVRDKRYMAVTSRPWSLDGSKGDLAKAKLIEDHLFGLGMHKTIKQMMDAIAYGYQVHEIIWDIVDGLILPIEIKDKPQEWFRFDEDGKLKLMERSGKTLELPSRKFMLTRHQASATNPYGKAVMSRCFWPIAFKKGGLKFWMIFVEKFGHPKVIGKTPSSSTDIEKRKLLQMLAGLVRDAVAVIPDNGDVSLLETKSGGSQPHPAIVKWADSEMSKAWLGETLTTEQSDKGGTRALGEVHNEVRNEYAMDDAGMVEEVLNLLIRWIYELNWPSDKHIPWFNIQLPEDLQLGRLDRDKRLHGMGLRFNGAYFVDTYGIDPKHIATVVQGGQSQQSEAEFAEGDASVADAITRLMEDLSPSDLQDQIQQLAQPIIDLANKYGTYAEFEKALDKILPDISSKKLEDAVMKCLLLTEMQGRADA